jgi:hypothetical protein
MRRIVAVVFGSLLTVSAIGSGIASAEPAVVVRGSCSDGARSRLELTDHGSRIRVRFRVHEGFSGDRAGWRIRMRHNGDLFFRGTRRTRGDGGHLSVHDSVRDGNGADRFVVRGVDTSTRQVCRAHAESDSGVSPGTGRTGSPRRTASRRYGRPGLSATPCCLGMVKAQEISCRTVRRGSMKVGLESGFWLIVRVVNRER